MVVQSPPGTVSNVAWYVSSGSLNVSCRSGIKKVKSRTEFKEVKEVEEQGLVRRKFPYHPGNEQRIQDAQLRTRTFTSVIQITAIARYYII